MKSITPEKLREVAAGRIIDISLGDLSAKLAIKNSEIGLGKMIFALRALGYDDSGLRCVFSPDGGITRNRDRWTAGFGYGCAIIFPFISLDDPIFFPEIKPNACGIIMARVKDIPEPQKMIEKMKILESDLIIKGKKIKHNLGTSNHFVETYVVERSDNNGLAEGDKVAILHASPAEYKYELSDLGFWESEGGAYLDTPLGPIFYVRGVVAKKYLEQYFQIDSFSGLRRETMIRELFNVGSVVINSNHQGIFRDSVIRLGLYDTAEAGGENIYPVTLSWDTKVPLVKGSRGFSESSGKINGLNILPHGGGYKLPELHFRDDLSNDSVMYLENDNSKMLIKTPSDLPFSYRTTGIIEGIEKHGLGEVVGEMSQVYTLKY